MRILITGASGFLGQYVLKHLDRQGIETVAIGRTLPANCAPVSFRQADLLGPCNFDELFAGLGATYLLHLGWYVEHGAYWSSPLNFRWVEATARLVKAFCSSGGQKVVVAGTCAEYDWAHGYCTEDITPLNPNSVYGIAKDSTRRVVMAICAEHKVDCAWGRIFLPYGRGEDNRRLIPSLVDVFQGKRPPFGVNTTAYRDFLHADDLAMSFIKLLLTDASGVYNVCSGKPVQLAEVVRRIAQSLDVDPQLVLTLSTVWPNDPHFLVGNNQKLKALGWDAKYSITDIVATMLQ